MTQREEINALRDEVAALREQVAQLSVALVYATAAQRTVQHALGPQQPQWLPAPWVSPWTTIVYSDTSGALNVN